MTLNNRREFIKNSVKGAGAVAAASCFSIGRSSGFPYFNQSKFSAATINSVHGYFRDMGNKLNSGIHPTSGDLNGANYYYKQLVYQMAISGFHGAALNWLDLNRYNNYDNNLDELYNKCYAGGIRWGFGKFYKALHNSPYRQTNFTYPVVDPYGLPSSHVGAQYTLAHWASMSPSVPTKISPDFWSGTSCPSGMVFNEVAGTCIEKSPSPPGSKETFCFYANFFIAYFGVMAVPLAMETATFPPLGIAIGIAAAFSGMFAWGICG